MNVRNLGRLKVVCVDMWVGRMRLFSLGKGVSGSGSRRIGWRKFL